MVVELELQKKMKITLGTAFKMYGCLGWVAHSEETDKYVWYNSNSLSLLGEDLDCELLEIEDVIECKNGKFIIVFVLDFDHVEEEVSSIDECIKEIEKCWSGKDE